MSATVEFKELVVEFEAAAFQDEDHERCLVLMTRMEEHHVTAEILRETKVGKLVNKLRKHTHEELGARSRALVKKWKDAVGSGRKRKKPDDASSTAAIERTDSEMASDSADSKAVMTDEQSAYSEENGSAAAAVDAGADTEGACKKLRVDESGAAVPTFFHTAGVEAIHKVGVEEAAASATQNGENEFEQSSSAAFHENGVEIEVPAAVLQEAESVPAPSPRSQDARASEFANKERIINMTTGNKVRDTARTKFAKALSQQADDENTANAAKELGVAIETAMFQKFGNVTHEYKAKYRLLLSNLMDPQNPDLKERILSNIILPPQLIEMGYQDLASNALKEDRARRAKEQLEDNLADGTTSSLTDMFKCFKCKSRKTSYYQLQTRGGDEPMTTFVTCVNCKNRWRC